MFTCMQTLAVSPGDSSAWSYHRWLAYMVMQHGAADHEQAGRAVAMLEAEESRAAELAATEQKRLETEHSSLLEYGSSCSSLVWPVQMCAELSSLHRQMCAGQVCTVTSCILLKRHIVVIHLSMSWTRRGWPCCGKPSNVHISLIFTTHNIPLQDVVPCTSAFAS
jgi:hypothetical protein